MDKKERTMGKINIHLYLKEREREIFENNRYYSSLCERRAGPDQGGGGGPGPKSARGRPRGRPGYPLAKIGGGRIPPGKRSIKPFLHLFLRI